jgi:hypothetical protein
MLIFTGCYNVPAGLTITSAAQVVIARIFPDGHWDTSIVLTDGSYVAPQSIISNIVSLDGTNQFWLAGGPPLSYIASSPNPIPQNLALTSGVRYWDRTVGTGLTSTLLYNAWAVTNLAIGERLAPSMGLV